MEARNYVGFLQIAEEIWSKTSILTEGATDEISPEVRQYLSLAKISLENAIIVFRESVGVPSAGNH